VTTSALSAPTTVQHPAGAWDEPNGLPVRGTLVVLTGRGETAAAYQRFGRRIAADAYRVRVVEVDLDDLDTARAAVEALLADETLPAPHVLVGSDTGATYAALLAGLDGADGLDGVDAVVLAGLALPESGAVDGGWDDELEARTGCPAHRRVISEDDAFARGALATPLPAAWDGLRLAAPARPTLVLHGSADPITTSNDAFAPFRDVPGARLRLVVGGRHDVLNDLSHRSVAATVILFLESLKLGAELPPIVGNVQG
jgi:pimeloyl-ACP methyl ester carboxylesterase